MERYGIFKRLANGAAMWVCAADDLTHAKTTIQTLSEEAGLEYFIHDFHAGTVIASSRKNKADSPTISEGV